MKNRYFTNFMIKNTVRYCFGSHLLVTITTSQILEILKNLKAYKIKFKK